MFEHNKRRTPWFYHHGPVCIRLPRWSKISKTEPQNARKEDWPSNIVVTRTAHRPCATWNGTAHPGDRKERGRAETFHRPFNVTADTNVRAQTTPTPTTPVCVFQLLVQHPPADLCKNVCLSAVENTIFFALDHDLGPRVCVCVSLLSASTALTG